MTPIENIIMIIYNMIIEKDDDECSNQTELMIYPTIGSCLIPPMSCVYIHIIINIISSINNIIILIKL